MTDGVHSGSLVATFDGGCRNRVCGAGAAVLFDSGGVELASKAIYMRGGLVTTNIAEYAGLSCALWLVREAVLRDGHHRADVRILGDSEIIVRQVNGLYQCRKEHLRPWLSDTLWLIDDLKDMGVTVVVDLFPRAGKQNKRRYGNHAADALATRCMRAERDLP